MASSQRHFVEVTEHTDQPNIVTLRLDLDLLTDDATVPAAFTDPSQIPDHPGLTEFGREAIMNMLHMGIDRVEIATSSTLTLTGQDDWEAAQTVDAGDAALELAANTSSAFDQTWHDHPLNPTTSEGACK